MDQAKKSPEHDEPLESQESSEATAELLPEPSEQEKLADELAVSKDKFLRLAAEFENFKKMAARERSQGLKFANEALIVALLPSIDSLEQAVKAGKSGDMAGAHDLLVGVDMVLKQIIDTLTKFGVEFFSAQGQAFDPARHEALCEQEISGVDEGTVVEEYQKGCLLHGRLLRAARVAVAKASSV